MRPMRTDQVVVGDRAGRPGGRRPRRPGRAGVRLADDALAAIARSRDVVDRLAEDDRPHYGDLDRLRRARHHGTSRPSGGPSCSAA